MVIVVTQGQTRTGGYGISVKAIRDTGSRLVVTVDQSSPAPDCVVPQVLAAPYHAVRVRRTDRPVTVERRNIVNDCTE
jgi:hypothetical protein